MAWKERVHNRRKRREERWAEFLKKIALNFLLFFFIFFFHTMYKWETFAGRTDITSVNHTDLATNIRMCLYVPGRPVEPSTNEIKWFARVDCAPGQRRFTNLQPRAKAFESVFKSSNGFLKSGQRRNTCPSNQSVSPTPGCRSQSEPTLANSQTRTTHSHPKQTKQNKLESKNDTRASWRRVLRSRLCHSRLKSSGCRLNVFKKRMDVKQTVYF